MQWIPPTHEEAFFLKQTLNDRYRPERVLARGGMGTVFLGSDLQRGRHVAIKILRTTFDQETIARFQREAEVIGTLDHPNIVKLFDYGTQHGTPFLILEYVEGRNLSAIILQGRLSILATIELSISIVLALKAAHSLGIIHRDLKPANILVQQLGDRMNAKLVDFGIAFVESDNTRLTRDGALCGTPGYISPEQIRGQHVQPSTDFYSLGIVIYECLTGKRAFKGETPLAVLISQSKNELPELRNYELDIPPAFERFLERLLQPNASARFQTAQEVLNALLSLRKELGFEEQELRQTLMLNSIAPVPADETSILKQAPIVLDASEELQIRDGGDWDILMNSEPDPNVDKVVDPQVFEPNPNMLDISFEFETNWNSLSDSTHDADATQPNLHNASPGVGLEAESDTMLNVVKEDTGRERPKPVASYEPAPWEKARSAPVVGRDFSNLQLATLHEQKAIQIPKKKRFGRPSIPSWLQFLAIVIVTMAITFFLFYLITERDTMKAKIPSIKGLTPKIDKKKSFKPRNKNWNKATKKVKGL